MRYLVNKKASWRTFKLNIFRHGIINMYDVLEINCLNETGGTVAVDTQRLDAFRKRMECAERIEFIDAETYDIIYEVHDAQCVMEIAGKYGDVFTIKFVFRWKLKEL